MKYENNNFMLAPSVCRGILQNFIDFHFENLEFLWGNIFKIYLNFVVYC